MSPIEPEKFKAKDSESLKHRVEPVRRTDSIEKMPDARIEPGVRRDESILVSSNYLTDKYKSCSLYPGR